MSREVRKHGKEMYMSDYINLDIEFIYSKITRHYRYSGKVLDRWIYVPYVLIGIYIKRIVLIMFNISKLLKEIKRILGDI